LLFILFSLKNADKYLPANKENSIKDRPGIEQSPGLVKRHIFYENFYGNVLSCGKRVVERALGQADKKTLREGEITIYTGDKKQKRKGDGRCRHQDE
jgi:hypothetical protein